MTVIAAVVDRDAGRVHMAADSAGVRGDDLYVANRKIHTVKAGADDRVLLAGSGRVALFAVARSSLNITATPSDDTDDQDAWAQAIAESITDTCRERGLVDDDRDIEGRLLLAWRHRLWDITTDLAIPVDDYTAVGSGAGVAMGAMWALPDIGPERRAGAGARAAIEHVAGLKAPVLAVST